MDKNKKELFRGAIGKVTDRIQQQEVAKLKAPFVEALQQLAQRQEQQHQEDEYYGDYSQLPGYARGKNKVRSLYKNQAPKLQNGFGLNDELTQLLTEDEIAAENAKRMTWLRSPDAFNPKYQTSTKKPVFAKKEQPTFPLLNDRGIVKAANKENLIAGVLGGLTSMKQYFDAKGQDIYTPDIFQDNPYRNRAMQTLAGMRISPYGAMRQIQDMNRRAMYQVNNSGGLSGGQKYYANVASMLGSQQNMANAIMAAQEQNNKYLGAYADAGMNFGKEYATNRIGANQYSTDYASKAHAAQLQGMQLGQQNFLGQLQQYMANKNKIDIYNGMRSVYQQDVDDKKQAAFAKLFG